MQKIQTQWYYARREDSGALQIFAPICVVALPVCRNIHCHFSYCPVGATLNTPCEKPNINEAISAVTQNHLNAALQRFNLELIEYKKSFLVEKIKTIINGIIRNRDEVPAKNLEGSLVIKTNSLAH